MIRQAFSGYSDSYVIYTIRRGKEYLVSYGRGFHSNNIMYSSIRHNIHEWNAMKQTFIVKG